MASTGDILLKDVWLRKNMVQSSSCFSAPSGNMRFAQQQLIRAEWLWELIREHCTPVDVKLGEQHKRAMVGHIEGT